MGYQKTGASNSAWPGIVLTVLFPQSGVPHLAKDLLWEPETPGPLPLLHPGPGKGSGPRAASQAAPLVASLPYPQS